MDLSKPERFVSNHQEVVQAAWVDYNGHMNVAYYVLAFDHATDAALDRLGLGAAYREEHNRSVFVGEMHVDYRREVILGDELLVRSTVLAADAKRLVLFHCMTCPRLDQIVASNEVLCVHVDLGSRRSAPWPPAIAHRLAAAAAQAKGPMPKGVHRTIILPE